jgi:hypothetical protein
MGLFDNFFGTQKESQEMAVQEAFAGILLGAAAADGHIADEEAEGLWTTLARMRMFDSWTGQKFSHMMGKLVKILKRHDVDGLLDRCVASLPQKLHETAFANACDIVLADGVVEAEEEEFLEKLQRKLDVSGDEALTIVEVMIIKNKG